MGRACELVSMRSGEDVGRMVRVYGASDDLVEITGSDYPEKEIDCYDANVRLWFSDGTVILVGYPKKDLGVWWVKVEERGSAFFCLHICRDENADPYSDMFEIEAEVVRHEVVEVA